jgi:arsenate reductase-like glutaredoxin family protein
LACEHTATWLELDPQTGLPCAIGNRELEPVPLATTFGLLVGGHERRGLYGVLEYVDAVLETAVRRTGPVLEQLDLDGRMYTVPLVVGGWRGQFRYRFKATAPAITWDFVLEPGPEAPVLRDVQITLGVTLPDAAQWTCQAPGTKIRPDLPVADLPPKLLLHGLGGDRGAAGVLALCDEARPATLVIWPRSLTEKGNATVQPTPAGVQVTNSTRLAAVPQEGLRLDHSGVALDWLPQGWATTRAGLAGWIEDLGLATPADRAEWTARATIYEVQIGRSLFAGGAYVYEPYPDMAALLADLPRIRSLGFDTIQLMPRQPFPSYNVIDYSDIETSYGSETDLKAVITWCHEHGMKLILDVILHGVIDQESIDAVAQEVREGPWAELISADAATIAALHLSDDDQDTLAWCRHILDFEQAWHNGSPAHHPLLDQAPDWFTRYSDGRVNGVYTKAFDLSHPGWQRYFGDQMIWLVQTLGVDGFRFDAPGYNRFPNWAPRTAARASVQELGAVPLFRELRRRLHALNPQLMLYTEPNAPLFRQDMDLNYNYDEVWLPDSLFGRGGDHPASRVRHARDLARWLQDRDAALAPGSVTAHHLDSHDTFWWPLPGAKWRREQIGLPATRALMTAYALAGGPYMMFVGGEDGMVDDVAAMGRVRAARPEIGLGRHQFGLDGLGGLGELDGLDGLGPPAADNLFVVRHAYGEWRSVLLVNLSDQPLAADLSAGLPGPWEDLLAADTARAGDAIGGKLELPAFGAAFWIPVS